MEFWESELQAFDKDNKFSKEKIFGLIFKLLVIFMSFLFIIAYFLIGDYQKIDRADALVFEGEYEKYIHNTQGRSDSYYVVLDDGTTLKVPIQRQSVRDAIKKIQIGQDITILAHPKSEIILSLCVDGNYIIDFDEAQEYMEEYFQEADVFFWIGVVLLASIVGHSLITIIIKVSKKKK